jgi:hypothetical protein
LLRPVKRAAEFKNNPVAVAGALQGNSSTASAYSEIHRTVARPTQWLRAVACLRYAVHKLDAIKP